MAMKSIGRKSRKGQKETMSLKSSRRNSAYTAERRYKEEEEKYCTTGNSTFGQIHGFNKQLSIKDNKSFLTLLSHAVVDKQLQTLQMETNNLRQTAEDTVHESCGMMQLQTFHMSLYVCTWSNIVCVTNGLLPPWRSAAGVMQYGFSFRTLCAAAEEDTAPITLDQRTSSSSSSRPFCLPQPLTWRPTLHLDALNFYISA